MNPPAKFLRRAGGFRGIARKEGAHSRSRMALMPLAMLGVLGATLAGTADELLPRRIDPKRPFEASPVAAAQQHRRLAGILQGIVGRVRDGTANSPHAAQQADRVLSLAQASWKFAQKAGAT